MDDEARSQYVWVYQYTYWDADTKAHKTSATFATLETIRMGLGIPVFEAAMKVAADAVVDGEYRPKQHAPRARRSVTE